VHSPDCPATHGNTRWHAACYPTLHLVRWVLKGKIISIERRSELDWRLIIDGHHKKFMTYNAVESYLVFVLREAKDENKKALLREDMEKLFRENIPT
jgi:hypothetical protein